jgi:hypothetical protein
MDNRDSLCCRKYVQISQEEPASYSFQGCSIVRTLDNDQTAGRGGWKQLQMEVTSGQAVGLADWYLTMVCSPGSAGLRQPH